MKDNSFFANYTDAFDYICTATIANINHCAKESNKINLIGLDINNKNHLFFLQCALAYKTISNKEISSDCSAVQRLKLNKKFKSIGVHIFKYKEEDGARINVEETLGFLRKFAVQNTYPDFEYADIYKFYYEKEKGE